MQEAKRKTEEVATEQLSSRSRVLQPNAPTAWLEIAGKGKAKDK